MLELGELAPTFEEWADLLSRTPGLLTENDGLALALGVIALTDFENARARLAKDGREIPDSYGGMKANPAIRDERAAHERIRQFIVDFGLSPAERAGLAIPTSNGPKSLAEVLAG
jgi:P27 family predicted phage terminase small subunit